MTNLSVKIFDFCISKEFVPTLSRMLDEIGI
jgi:hypothetical protein